MLFSEIKELTYINGICTINSVSLPIDGVVLPVGVEVIQYHSVFDYYIEEPAMIKVPLEKYSNILTKWNAYVREPETLPVYDESTQKLVEDGTEVIAGLTYKKYIATALTQEELEAKFKATVPATITMRQARLVLLQAELLSTIESAITSGTDETMKIEWEYATEVKRDWESLIALAAALGMSELDIDNLFIAGGTL